MKLRSVFVALLILGSAAGAQACSVEPVDGASCTTIGETCMTKGGDTLFACLNETAYGANQKWKSMTGGGGGASSSAIVAYDLDKCPDGWHIFAPLAGRTVIGVGVGAGLTSRVRGDNGGEEQHTLTVHEMPNHTHYTMHADGGGYNCGGGADPTTLWWNDKCGWPANSRTASPTGDGAAHNTMPPYYALLYCEKN